MANTQLWHLVARKLSGEASLEELRELEQLLRDEPELAYKIDVYTQYFENPSTEKERSIESKRSSWELTKAKLANEFPGVFTSTNDTYPATISSRKPFLKWLAAAGILLILATGGFIWFNRQVPGGQDQASNELTWKEMNTMPGTRSKTILPDGTIVWLNSDSKVTYNADFGKHKREITLTGEAFFDVAHNAEVPMLVKAKNVNIWVKGTAFNVKNYPESEQVVTSLIRGSVELTTDADPDRKILLKPNEKITIEVKPEGKEPGVAHDKTVRPPKSFYQIEKLKESTMANVIPEISWVQNKLVFDNEPFAEIERKMEKWYNVEIIVRNKSLETKSFSGTFEKENISQALEALQLIRHFEFEVKGSKVYIK